MRVLRVSVGYIGFYVVCRDLRFVGLPQPACVLCFGVVPVFVWNSCYNPREVLHWRV